MEIAKPLRRSDSPLEYLPTQYISEFIKSERYQGVKYLSTMNPDGYNLALYDNGAMKEQLECTKVSVLEVRQLNYTTEQII
jgi:hypothetical protein